MSAIPYMPLYVADYMADAAHLTTEEHGAYMLLIMTYWQRGKPLPSDPVRLANIARLSNERWTDVQRTLNEFFTEADGQWHHRRIDLELRKVREKSAKAKAAGIASGQVRENKNPTETERSFNGRSTDVQRTLNHTDTDTDTDLERERGVSRQAAKPPPNEPPVDCERKEKPARASRWPPDAVVPDDWIAAAEAKRSEHALEPIDLRLAAERFGNYWATKAGGGAAKMDWRRAWINWALREDNHGRAATNGARVDRRVSAHDSFILGAAAAVGRTSIGDE